MLKVLGRISSSNVQKVLWCLGELGLDFEHDAEYGGPFGRTQEPDYLAMNPNGLVPTLIDGYAVLWESHTIVRYLGALHGQDTLWPTDALQRAQCEKWMDWNQSVLDRAYFSAFYELIRKSPQERNMAAVEKAVKDTSAVLPILDRALAKTGFVHGDQLSIGDIVFGPTLHRWHSLDIKRPALANVAAWYQAMLQRPAYKKYVAVELS